MADSSGDRPGDPPTRLTEPAADVDLRRWGSTLATQRGDDRAHMLVRRFTLLVTAGPDAGQRFISTGERMVVGTHRSCDVVLQDPTVSRFQCEIAPTGKTVSLRDLDSSNGTIVDGVSIQHAYLKSGCMLTLGRTQLRFDTGGDPVRVPLSGKDRFGLLVGGSAAIRRVFAQLERAAANESSVLIEGDSGTGKLAAAESVHAESARRTGPFVVVDCGGGPAELLERDLSGLETGAFAAARSGTLVLDDVGALPDPVQAQLVRLLEGRPAASGARMVATSPGSLKLEVNARRFRSDLYHQLAAIECRLPPLRERPDDLPLLVERLLETLGASRRPEAELLRTRDFYAELARHAWPGNVRELGDYVERCLALRAPASGGEATPAALDRPLRAARDRWTRGFEERYLDGLLRMHDGNVASAARAAGVDRIHLHRLLWKHGMK